MTLLLEVDTVSKVFHSGMLLSRVRTEAVIRVSFTLSAEKPEIFAIVGESGSGKSTLARMILGNETPSSGHLRLQGRDLATIRGRAERETFMSAVQPIFQNPFEAFNPLTPLDFYLFVSARRYRGARTVNEQPEIADEALHQVGLSLAEVRGRYSHELSGGQLQRIAVARALIPRPKLLVADEPVSMVDASLRMSIVNLFQTLRDDLGVTIIYITHALATASYISDRVIIMRKGEVVESGDARGVLANPQHPYSIALRNAVLPPDPKEASEIIRQRVKASSAQAARKSSSRTSTTQAAQLAPGRVQPCWAGDDRSRSRRVAPPATVSGATCRASSSTLRIRDRRPDAVDSSAAAAHPASASRARTPPTRDAPGHPRSLSRPSRAAAR